MGGRNPDGHRDGEAAIDADFPGNSGDNHIAEECTGEGDEEEEGADAGGDGRLRANTDAPPDATTRQGGAVTSSAGASRSKPARPTRRYRLRARARSVLRPWHLHTRLFYGQTDSRAKTPRRFFSLFFTRSDRRRDNAHELRPQCLCIYLFRMDSADRCVFLGSLVTPQQLTTICRAEAASRAISRRIRIGWARAAGDERPRAIPLNCQNLAMITKIWRNSSRG